uniref:Uncharacterized protein n=1 Tax=Arundo donax TaxID=35708 RepID=A0A0A8ZQV7_ARUDO
MGKGRWWDQCYCL